VGASTWELDGFDRHALVSDADFTNTAAYSEADVQAFLQATPWGESFLATETVASGERVSAALIRVAQEHRLNPLTLLVTLQKESSLVSKTRSNPPTQHLIDFAFGCGCPDGSVCDPARRGLDKQLACAGHTLRKAFDAAAAGRATVGGYRVGERFTSLDGLAVTPENAATASLYNYTPWVLEGRGGNWLFWNVWRRFEGAMASSTPPPPEPPFNDGLIGDLCTDNAECDHPWGGFCWAGACATTCQNRWCPGQDGGTRAFCVSGGAGGLCVAECDPGRAAGPCPSTFRCEYRLRHEQPTVRRKVCVP